MTRLGLGNGELYPFSGFTGLFAVDRRKYAWLCGFDSLYDPLTWRISTYLIGHEGR